MHAYHSKYYSTVNDFVDYYGGNTLFALFYIYKYYYNNNKLIYFL